MLFSAPARIARLFACAIAALSLFAATPPAAADVVPGEILIGLNPGRAGLATTAAAIDSLGTQAGQLPQLGAVRLKLRAGLSIAAAIQQLQGRPGVRYAEPNHVLHALTDPNDDYYSTDQYAPQLTQANLAWDLWTPTATTVIAIVDTGIDNTHPDLKNKIFRDASGIVGYSALTGARDDAKDGNGHGTHCSGIAAAEINNTTGIAGIAGWNPAIPNSNSFIKLMPVKVLDANGDGTDATVADGVVWAADHGARVISLSLGGTGTSTPLSDAMQYAWNKGCVIAAAAGNESTSTLSYPAAYPHVIAVAATNSSDTLTSYSNYGSWVNVAAPGSHIFSTTPTYTTPENLSLNYDYLSGTSMATPHVAGEAALLFSMAPALTNVQVRSIILTSVDPYTPYSGRTIASGGGRINIYKAVSAIAPPPGVSAVAVAPDPVNGGLNATGTVTLTRFAPSGGETVTLASSNTAVAQVPATVTVPAGSSSATFAVTTTGVAAATSVTLSATASATTKTAVLKVYRPIISNLTFSPNPIVGGVWGVGTITLRGLAPAGGQVVVLSSGNTAVAEVPATVTVLPGESTAKFNIRTHGVASATTVQITANVNGYVWTIPLRVYPPGIADLTFSPNPVNGGLTATGTIVLRGQAPSGGQSVTLTSSDPAVAQVPTTVTVPGGTSTATFAISTTGVSTKTTVQISANVNGIIWTIPLKVYVPIIANLTFSPNPVKGGWTATATIVLRGAAPAGGQLVTLSSSNVAVAQVPSSITIPAGATTATFPITTSSVATATAVTITANVNGSIWGINLNVQP